jgi:hypothetical protein
MGRLGKVIELWLSTWAEPWQMLPTHIISRSVVSTWIEVDSRAHGGVAGLRLMAMFRTSGVIEPQTEIDLLDINPQRYQWHIYGQSPCVSLLVRHPAVPQSTSKIGYAMPSKRKDGHVHQRGQIWVTTSFELQSGPSLMVWNVNKAWFDFELERRLGYEPP